VSKNHIKSSYEIRLRPSAPRRLLECLLQRQRSRKLTLLRFIVHTSQPASDLQHHEYYFAAERTLPPGLSGTYAALTLERLLVRPTDEVSHQPCQCEFDPFSIRDGLYKINLLFLQPSSAAVRESHSCHVGDKEIEEGRLIQSQPSIPWGVLQAASPSKVHILKHQDIGLTKSNSLGPAMLNDQNLRLQGRPLDPRICPRLRLHLGKPLLVNTDPEPAWDVLLDQPINQSLLSAHNSYW
jgi:hypothetical protein